MSLVRTWWLSPRSPLKKRPQVFYLYILETGSIRRIRLSDTAYLGSFEWGPRLSYSRIFVHCLSDTAYHISSYGVSGLQYLGILVKSFFVCKRDDSPVKYINNPKVPIRTMECD